MSAAVLNHLGWVVSGGAVHVPSLGVPGFTSKDTPLSSLAAIDAFPLEDIPRLLVLEGSSAIMRVGDHYYSHSFVPYLMARVEVGV